MSRGPRYLSTGSAASRLLGAALLLSVLIPSSRAGSAPSPATQPGSSQQVSGTLTDHFLGGNEAYHQGRFEDAVAAYEKVTRYGILDPDLEYNLGNALLRAGRLGEAILHYERSLRAAPRARDAVHNLHLAESRLSEGLVLELMRRGIKVGEGSEAAWVAFFRTLTRNEAAVALLLVNALAFGLLLLRSRPEPGSTLRTLLGWSAGIMLAVTATLGLYCTGQAYIEDHVRLGVVTSSTPVREGPSPEAQVLFQAPEGLKLRIGESPVQGWRSVRVNEELQGFVEKTKVQPIDP